MAERIPVVRQIAWGTLIYQIALMVLFIWLYSKTSIKDPALAGGLTFIGLVLVLRFAFSGLHRKGMRHIRKMEYDKAIPYFEGSYEFYTRNSFLDKYRAYLMLSASLMFYKEMALNNIGFCYSQMDKKEEAIFYYRKCVEEYPNCTMAKVALKMLEA
jgi:tetratricopeptide (TPR) repeat protein